METSLGENEHIFSQSVAVLTLALYVQACAQQAAAVQPTEIQPRLPSKLKTTLTSTPDYAFQVDPELSRIAREVAECILQYGEISDVYCDEGWPCQQRKLTIDGMEVEAVDFDETRPIPRCTDLDPNVEPDSITKRILYRKKDPSLPFCGARTDRIKLSEDINPNKYRLELLESIDTGLDGNVDEAILPREIYFWDFRRWGLTTIHNPGRERYCVDKQNPDYFQCSMVANWKKREEAQAQYRRQLLRVHAACRIRHFQKD